ncbi:MAG: VWA domain-containing protein [Eubacterium sp.]|nr:VWA domain-containing protein [Eubacterium sp.]
MLLPILEPQQEMLLKALLPDTPGRGRGKHKDRRAKQRQRLDVVKTLGAAALRQGAEQKKGPLETDLALEVRRADLRFKCPQVRGKLAVLFLLDVSRSQGVEKRLGFVKGAVLSLLSQTYTSRDKAGVVVFGDGRAELLLPLTRSVEYARDRLEGLWARGNTPLALGIEKALEVLKIEAQKKDGAAPVLVLVTDGKATYDPREGDPFGRALEAAGQVARREIPAVVIDTDQSRFSLGFAKKIAEAMAAEWRRL